MKHWHTLPGGDVCAADVARMVAEYARAVWADMFAADDQHVIILPNGGVVELSALTATQAAIMPYIGYTRANGEPGMFSPDSRSMLSRGALLHPELSASDERAIGLVCERARRAQAKSDARERVPA